MQHKLWIILLPLLMLGIIAGAVRPAAAEPPLQVAYQTPTALPDGRVIYTVQEGDSCLRIELLTSVKVSTLIELNKLDQDCTISPGQELLLAMIVPEATATPNPDMTATPLLPTPTPEKGSGKICVVLFNDVNGNAVHDTTEAVMDGGAVSVSNRIGSVSETGTTNALAEEPMCIDVPEGEFNISMGIPNGYNGTTLLTEILQVQAGETAILEFGAQTSSVIEVASPETGPQPAASGSSLLLAILGGVLILGGVGLGAYILLTRGK